MAGKFRYLDFDALVLINKEVVSLRGEKHVYEEEDEKRMKSMLRLIEDLDAGTSIEDGLVKKGALLVFKIASGQNFHEGNKRTALVAGLTFLKMNGFEFDVEDPRLVSVVDRAGVAKATLKEVEDVLGLLTIHV